MSTSETKVDWSAPTAYFGDSDDRIVDAKGLQRCESRGARGPTKASDGAARKSLYASQSSTSHELNGVSPRNGP
jgi:hypothetical protein